jgi:hypothetical protein
MLTNLVNKYLYDVHKLVHYIYLGRSFSSTIESFHHWWQYNFKCNQMAQQMEHLNGQTLQKLQQDRLVIELDANFTNLQLCNLDVWCENNINAHFQMIEEHGPQCCWGLFIFIYVSLHKHKHKGMFGTLFYLLMVYQYIFKLVSLKNIISITKQIQFCRNTCARNKLKILQYENQSEYILNEFRNFVNHMILQGNFLPCVHQRKMVLLNINLKNYLK